MGWDMRASVAGLCLIVILATACSRGPLIGSLGLGNGKLFARQAEHNTLAPARGYPSYVDPRPLAAGIENVATERTRTGLILRAVVAVGRSGYRGVELTRRREALPGQLVLEAHVQGSGSGTGGTSFAMLFLSNAELAGIGQIAVVSATNSVTIRP